MLEAFQFFATLATALFCGASIYINIAEHPSRMVLDDQSAAAQWATSYKRATWMQAPLAVVGFLAGVGAWLVGGGRPWLIAALLIGAVVPLTLMIVMPVNQRLLAPDRDMTSTRELLQRWGKLHALRTVLSAIATVIMLWTLLGSRDGA
jgi:Anthrone oxygenase